MLDKSFKSCIIAIVLFNYVAIEPIFFVTLVVLKGGCNLQSPFLVDKILASIRIV
jgi:hypothetical protein